MPKRSKTPAERAALERVKARHDAELAALNEFFVRERRIESLRADVATLEAQQAQAAARLVEATSVAQAAEALGWPQSRVRDALGRRAPAARASEAAVESP